jgi:hypothetical protein
MKTLSRKPMLDVLEDRLALSGGAEWALDEPSLSFHEPVAATTRPAWYFILPTADLVVMKGFPFADLGPGTVTDSTRPDVVYQDIIYVGTGEANNYRGTVYVGAGAYFDFNGDGRVDLVGGRVNGVNHTWDADLMTKSTALIGSNEYFRIPMGPTEQS